MEEIREPEVWKDIPGYEGIYQVSSWGNVKSFDRYASSRGGFQHLHKGRMLKINYKGDYPQICLSKNNQKKTYRIHILVDKLFNEDVDFLFVVNHINSNKKDNYYKNLEKIYSRENQTHYYKEKTNKTSIYTGVSFDKTRKKNPWVASIRIEGKSLKIGNFNTEYEAFVSYSNYLKENNIRNKYAEKNTL
jgi:hypothetical protein